MGGHELLLERLATRWVARLLDAPVADLRVGIRVRIATTAPLAAAVGGNALPVRATMVRAGTRTVAIPLELRPAPGPRPVSPLMGERGPRTAAGGVAGPGAPTAPVNPVVGNLFAEPTWSRLLRTPLAGPLSPDATSRPGPGHLASRESAGLSHWAAMGEGRAACDLPAVSARSSPTLSPPTIGALAAMAGAVPEPSRRAVAPPSARAFSPTGAKPEEPDLARALLRVLTDLARGEGEVPRPGIDHRTAPSPETSDATRTATAGSLASGDLAWLLEPAGGPPLDLEFGAETGTTHGKETAERPWLRLECDLSQLGRVRLELFATHAARTVLLRTERPLSGPCRAEIFDLFAAALEIAGRSGRLLFARFELTRPLQPSPSARTGGLWA